MKRLLASLGLVSALGGCGSSSSTVQEDAGIALSDASLLAVEPGTDKLRDGGYPVGDAGLIVRADRFVTIDRLGSIG